MKGSCLRYDVVDEVLIATPFEGSPNCWNAADWIVILSPCCFWVITMLILIITCFQEYKEDQRERKEDDEFIALNSLSDENSENPENLPQGENDIENH